MKSNFGKITDQKIKFYTELSNNLSKFLTSFFLFFEDDPINTPSNFNQPHSQSNPEDISKSPNTLAIINSNKNNHQLNYNNFKNMPTSYKCRNSGNHFPINTATFNNTKQNHIHSYSQNKVLNHQDELLTRIIKDYDKRFVHLKKLLNNTEKNTTAIQKIIGPLIPNTNCLVKHCTKQNSLIVDYTVFENLNSSSKTSSTTSASQDNNPENLGLKRSNSESTPSNLTHNNNKNLTPSFVIWGQSYNAKCDVVARILGKYILPHDIPTRPIRINSGPNIKSNQQQNSYVLLDNFEHVLSRPCSLDIKNSVNSLPEHEISEENDIIGKSNETVKKMPVGRKPRSSNQITNRHRNPSNSSLETNFALEDTSILSDVEEDEDDSCLEKNSSEHQKLPKNTDFSISIDYHLSKNSSKKFNKTPVDLGVYHPLLTAGWQMLISPTDSGEKFSSQEVLSFCTDSVTPFVLYALDKGRLTKREMSELIIARKLLPNTAICFVQTKDSIDNVSIF